MSSRIKHCARGSRWEMLCVPIYVVMKTNYNEWP